MKTTILKDKLKEGIGIVERVSGKTFNLPILNNILISVEKSFLSLTTTDLEVGVKWWSLVKTEKEGQIAVPARVLSGFVSFLPNKPVNLEKKDLSLEISCENYQTSIKGFEADEFPIIPKISGEEKIVLPSQDFCQGLSKVVDFASYSSTKPEISGLYLLFQKNLITMAATDSFRLGEKKIYPGAPLSGISQDYSLIIPQRAAKEIISIFGQKDGNLSIYFSANQIMLESSLQETSHPKVQLTSRLIEGDYPNYQEIIPQKSETKVTFQAQELLNQVKLASLFSGKINEVRIKADPKKNRLDIFSQSPEIGEHKSFLAAKVEGKGAEVSFNYRFLLDGLLQMPGGGEKNKEAVLELTGSDKPGVLRPRGDDNYLYLVMPIKSS
ncbi:MAG: DNA polymerase III subunit beta [bacterium]|nr:DNA polymerase III subunit beta [bacterium]